MDSGPERAPRLGSELLAACSVSVVGDELAPPEGEEEGELIHLTPLYAEGPPPPRVRRFAHPDGRRWAVQRKGKVRRVVIRLPGEAPLVRDEAFTTADDARRAVEELVSEQLRDGFVEEPG
jgi:hypothetical protein